MEIKTKTEFAGVPKGTTGTAIMDGNLWRVSWALPLRYYGGKLKPLMDWFNQGEFDQYLEIIHTEECIEYNMKYEHDTPGECICNE
jgi:hypothetical protein